MVGRPPAQKHHVLRDDLFNLGRLSIAYLNGYGLPDMFAHEMELGKSRYSKTIVHLNPSGWWFRDVSIELSLPAQGHRVTDLMGDGRPSIVSDP